MQLLLLEPDVLLAKQYSSALHEHDVVLAVDAQTAISLIDKTLPDLIVLELLLGPHNGVEFLYELRSYSDAQNIPIILNTYVDHEQFSSDESLLTELGVVDYLYKPSTSLRQLAAAVERQFSRVM